MVERKNYFLLSRSYDGFAADVRNDGYHRSLRQDRKDISRDEKRDRNQLPARKIHSALFALVRMGLYGIRQIYRR